MVSVSALDLGRAPGCGRRVLRLRAGDRGGSFLWACVGRLGWLGRLGMAARLGKSNGDRQQYVYQQRQLDERGADGLDGSGPLKRRSVPRRSRQHFCQRISDKCRTSEQHDSIERWSNYWDAREYHSDKFGNECEHDSGKRKRRQSECNNGQYSEERYSEWTGWESNIDVEPQSRASNGSTVSQQRCSSAIPRSGSECGSAGAFSNSEAPCQCGRAAEGADAPGSSGGSACTCTEERLIAFKTECQQLVPRPFALSREFPPPGLPDRW